MVLGGRPERPYDPEAGPSPCTPHGQHRHSTADVAARSELDGAGPSNAAVRREDEQTEEHHAFYVGGWCADKVILYHALSHFMRRLRKGECWIFANHGFAELLNVHTNCPAPYV